MAYIREKCSARNSQAEVVVVLAFTLAGIQVEKSGLCFLALIPRKSIVRCLYTNGLQCYDFIVFSLLFSQNGFKW